MLSFSQICLFLPTIAFLKSTIKKPARMTANRINQKKKSTLSGASFCMEVSRNVHNALPRDAEDVIEGGH